MWSDFEPAREIFLVFMDAPYFGDWLFKAGFRHVYAIERQGLGWMCSDPSRSDLHTYILPASYDVDVMAEFRKRHPNFTILHLMVKPHTNDSFPRASILSCVSIMQYILGVYWPLVLTPYQLYNRLKNKAPKHIEVIACHETLFTQHKGKQKQPLKKHS